MKAFPSLPRKRCSGGRGRLLGSGVAVLALLAGSLAIDLVGFEGTTGLIDSANAAPGGGGGGGNGGGGNGGGGNGSGGNGGGGGNGPPPNPGGGGGKPEFPGQGKGDLYADQVVLYRDTYGRPILIQKELLPEEPGEESPGTVFCLQPISAAPVHGLPTVTNPADGKTVSLIKLGTGIPGEECDVDPDPANVALVQEVLFGRLNLGRSPEKVLTQQLRDVTNSLAGSSAAIQLDEAGRFVWYDDGMAVEVDSPGQNLALHKELQVYGLPLVSQTNVEIPLPDVANPNDPTHFLDHAAAALGAAAGKGDLVNLDLVVYNNRILGIPDGTLAAGTLSTVTGGDVMSCPMAGISLNDLCQYGEIGRDGAEVYIDYGMEGYAYTRSAVFPGCVRGLLADFPSLGDFTPFSGTIMDCVFGRIEYKNGVGVCSGGQDFTGETAIHGFAQRADDARAVIAFVHGNAVADSTAVLPLEQAGVDQAGQTLVCGDMDSGSPIPASPTLARPLQEQERARVRNGQ